MMKVEVHMAGIISEEELGRLEQTLLDAEGIELHRIEMTRVDLSFEEDDYSARDIQGLIEKAGGEVLTMKPVG